MLRCLGKDTTGMHNISGHQQYVVKCRGVQIGRGGGGGEGVNIQTCHFSEYLKIIVQSTLLIHFVLH